MKKRILTSLAVAAVVLGAGNAFALGTWVGTLTNSNTTANNVQAMDWASSGSGLVLGQGAWGNVSLNVGDTFDFLYQTYLTGLQDAGGNAIDFPGLNKTTEPGAFEYTLVARFTEKVESIGVSFDGKNVTANFATVASSNGAWQEAGKFAMYYGETVNAQVTNGTGFNDGVKVMEGWVKLNQTSDFTTAVVNPTQGKGSGIIEMDVTFVDPNFFDPTLLPNGDPFLIGLRWEGTQNYPPGNSTTKSFFDGNDGFAQVTVDTTNDLVLKVDGSTTAQAIPEPATIFLMGSGLFSLAGISRRKMKKQA